MPYDSQAVLEARLENIRSAIEIARTQQNFASGNRIMAAANLQTLLQEEKDVLTKLEALIAQAGDSGSGTTNKVTFARPS